MTSYLPSPKEIRDLFGELLDRDVQVAPNAPLAPTPNNPCTVAVYVDDSLQVTAVVALDLPLSAHAGASIGLVPVAGAEAAIEERTLPEVLRENVYEVLNIAASLFNVNGARHVRLYDVHHAGAPVPGDVLARALTLGRREDLAVEVGGYGGGRLSVVLVA
ncbi:hypothetical protein EFK50_12970 [Nocardioides marmoriginsengisoli]|uniref:Uncharacterized protein n=1 Tax=Nocardioides marmoriginsengisoli TaxID=661483 RepID=A0A3N0CI80_9ACTN|nr:hypothetical protein [Nocardioides marmoriginsengisoli]RNL62663.1 hypothetical protein EFK50_12970 [Nocardioides marmoriginsengisoli]